MSSQLSARAITAQTAITRMSDHQDVDELMIASARLARILKPRKARCQALDHAARPRLHRTGNGQHVPQSTA
jgi:hypothetical protein